MEFLIHFKTAPPKLEYDERHHRITMVAGSTLRLNVQLFGSPAPQVTWFRNNKSLSDFHNIYIDVTEDTTLLTVKQVSQDDAGMYKVKAKNKLGESQAHFEVTVIGKLDFFVRKNIVLVQW